jgi:DNA-binding response OmpR family regulator
MQTILVVDDEPKIAQLARDYLEHAGFAVLTAADGQAALHATRTRHPDLDVLDLGLPGLDGLDVIRALLAAVKRCEPVPPLLFEFGGDEEGIRAAVAGSGLRLLDVITDLAGIPRVARVEA